MKLLHGVRVMIPRQQSDSTDLIPVEALAIVNDLSTVVHVHYIDAPLLDVVQLNGGEVIKGTSIVNMLSLYRRAPFGMLAVVYGDCENVGIEPHAVAVDARDTLENILADDLQSSAFGRGKRLNQCLDEGLMTIKVVEKQQYSVTVQITDQCERVLYVDILHGAVKPTNLGPHFQDLLGWT